MDLLSSSPTSSMVAPAPIAADIGDSELTLEDFLAQLPDVIRSRKAHAGSPEDPILRLFDHVKLDPDDWHRYAYFDPLKNYTRNLVSTDGETYTLLLLCWSPGKESPIHDHPCDGCWMRVLMGDVRECRYRYSQREPQVLECIRDETFTEGGIVFIEDSEGYHKVGNPSSTSPAVTMHLYSPPFQSCKIWLDERRQPSRSCICHYSEYGKKV